MCTISAIMEHYQEPFAAYVQRTHVAPISQLEVMQLRAVIKEFKEAVEAAKLIDRILKQPDCLDPDKGDLERRVAELEKRFGATA